MFFEKITWILDKKGNTPDEQSRKTNIDFVRSLGKKCDRVGWSVLNSDEPDAEKILDKIKAFCKENGFSARGWYERSFCGDSDWFELKTTDFGSATAFDTTDVKSEKGKQVSVAVIRAYNESFAGPKEYFGVCVPERFKNACEKNNLKDIDFCWVEDKGRYKAEQYFYIYPHTCIKKLACDKGLSSRSTAKIRALGGFLPKLAEVFKTFQQIELPDCFLASDLPQSGIACVYLPDTDSFCGRDKILIHKDTAEILIKEKALSKKDLSPAFVVDAYPKGYSVVKGKRKDIPCSEYIEKSLVLYEKIKNSERPKREIGEKDALKALKHAKATRPEDFNPKLNGNVTDEFNSLLSYYQISNGGYLSDEYTLLSYDDAVRETETLLKELKEEQLLKTALKGIVFASCLDGDSILLKPDGSVCRLSHESPEILDMWTSVAEFIFDAITEQRY